MVCLAGLVSGRYDRLGSTAFVRINLIKTG